MVFWCWFRLYILSDQLNHHTHVCKLPNLESSLVISRLTPISQRYMEVVIDMNTARLPDILILIDRQNKLHFDLTALIGSIKWKVLLFSIASGQLLSSLGHTSSIFRELSLFFSRDFDFRLYFAVLPPFTVHDPPVPSPATLVLRTDHSSQPQRKLPLKVD